MEGSPRVQDAEGPFRRCYLGSLVCLIAMAVLYIVHSIGDIIVRRDAPPVRLSTVHWGSYPMLGLCDAHGSTSHEATARIAAAKVVGVTNVMRLATGSDTNLNDVRVLRSQGCAIADLRGYGPSDGFTPQAGSGVGSGEASASIFFGVKVGRPARGADEFGSHLMALNFKLGDNDTWKRLTWVHKNTAHDYVLVKERKGWQLGYATTLSESFSVTHIFSWAYNKFQPGTGQPFADEEEEVSHESTCFPLSEGIDCYNILLKVPSHTVSEVLALGIVPRLTSKFSNLGDLASLATIVVGSVLVQKYTQGDFAVAYNTLALRGNQADSPVQLKKAPEAKGGYLDAEIID